MRARRAVQAVTGALAGAGAGLFCASCLGLAGGILGIGVGGVVGGVGGAILGAVILVGALGLGQARGRRWGRGASIACCPDEPEKVGRSPAGDEGARTP